MSNPVPSSPPSSGPLKIQNPQKISEEEKSKYQLISSKEEFCPPKLDPRPENQINGGELVQKYPASHAEKFNGPLEKPKTANKAFGSISDFLLFFENRNPDIKEFSKKFQEMESLTHKDSSLSLKILNEEIGPSVYKSFIKINVEFRNHESSKPPAQDNEQTQNLKSALSKFLQKKKIQKDPRTEYSQLFEKNFKSLEEFYKQILHAYTIPGFLFLRINEYLRTENWIKLDDLLIYTYCLFKAYLWGPTGLKDADSFEFLKSKSENNKLTLYRRADFDQDSLDFYCREKIKEFSWSGVTSTSLIESATRPFSGKRPTKSPVLITIEVDFKDLQPENFNALYLAKLSRCPAEEEVALAPGSIFELLEINKEKPEVEMRLKLVTDAKVLAHQGKFLHGMLQAVMRNGDDLKFVCLKEKELSRAIKHCQGNQLVKKLEFSLCDFNEESVEVFLDVLPTMKNLISLTFSSALLEGCLSSILENLENTNIINLEIENPLIVENDLDILLDSFDGFGSLESLKLSFGKNLRLDTSTSRILFNLVYNSLTPKCVFEFNLMNSHQIITKGLNRSNYKTDLAKFLFQTHRQTAEDPILGEEYFIVFSDEDKTKQQESELPKDMADQSLDLIVIKGLFEYSFERNSRSLKRTLLEALRDRYILGSEEDQQNEVGELSFSLEKQPLKELSLSFDKYLMIYDRDLKSLGCEGIQHIKSLTSLKFNFPICIEIKELNSHRWCGITDRALEILTNEVIQQLKGLVVLSLGFDESTKITDEGLKKLACNGIQHLTLLTTLDLNFSSCWRITDQGLLDLSLSGIAKLKYLTHLHLNFTHCSSITDKGFENLFQDDGGIQNLEALSDLSLNFSNCHKITDDGLKILCQKGLKNLKKSLKALSLNFDKCLKITDNGLKMLNYEGCLESLSNLSFSFSSHSKFNLITDQGFKIIAQNLSSLTTLHLNFKKNSQITNEGLRFLCFSNELINLHLSFNHCNNISDFGLESLSQKIKHLKSLENLHLNFSKCEKITDKGFSLLCSQGIKHLRKLKTLSLEFEILSHEFPLGIMDPGLKSLGSDGLQNLPELVKLHLNFDECNNITDEGIESLCRNGIQHLRKLTDLHLSFQRCQRLTNEALQILSSQLRESLHTLFLNFSWCGKLSDVGLRSLYQKGIRNLHKLKSLHLRFNHCRKMTNEGIADLADEGIRCLTLLTTLNLHFTGNEKVTTDLFLAIQYRINLLNRPNLQFSFESYVGDESQESDFPQSPNAASVLCQGRLGFLSRSIPYLQEEIVSEKTIENLTLRLLQESNLYITDLDVFKSIFSFNKMKAFTDLKTLHLYFNGCIAITDFTLHNLCYEGLKCLESLTALLLSFNFRCSITDTGLQILGTQGLKNLKKLRNLSLSFDGCELITDKGLEILKEIQHPELLDVLHLSFRGCINLTDKRFTGLCRTGIQRLQYLTSLSLNFNSCHQITNKGIKKLYHSGIKHLQFLRFLRLSFQSCQRITKKGLKILNQIYTQPLTSFCMNLGGIQIKEKLKKQLLNSSADSFIIIRKPNSELTEEKAEKILASRLRRQNVSTQKDFDDKNSGEIVTNEMLIRYIGRGHYMLKIHGLRLSEPSFNSDYPANKMFTLAKKDIIALLLLSHRKIFKEEAEDFIKKLYAQELRSFRSLTSLHLNLEGWKTWITDSDFNVLCLRIFKYLPSLMTLHLSLDGFSQITDEGLKNLGNEGIKHLKRLTTFHLSFDSQTSITDIGLKGLCSEGIQHLKNLAKLHLDFKECNGITDIGIESLWNDGVIHLKSLTILDISFEKCRKITGVCFKDIKRENLILLTQLRLNFNGCIGFKDEGLENLFMIQNLTNLTTLYLNFDGCEGITDSGLHSLNLTKLESLNALYLSFDRCQGITDQGVQNLGLKQLKLLTTLHLHFDQCQNLTPQALNNQISQLKSLQILHLSFRGCSVTDQALKDLNIAHFTLLNALYLCFDGCKQITDKGLEALCWHQIQPLKFLKTLYLSFGFCENITEKGLESLENDGIKYLSLLSNVHLCFIACKKISRSQLSALQDQISPFP